MYHIQPLFMAPNERLKAWLAAHDEKPAKFAKRLGYDRGNFHRLLKGDFKPSLDLAHKIERETNSAIPMSAWAEAA